MSKRKIVCLCGSTKFRKEFEEANKAYTLAGWVVLTVGAFPHTDNSQSPEEEFGSSVKRELDELHKDKILMADLVHVINVGGYIGFSTKNEIAHALAHGKKIEWLEPKFSMENVYFALKQHFNQ